MAKRDEPKTFGQVLAKALAAKGWTAYRLAKVTGVPENSIRHYLLGDREPGVGRAIKLFKALGLSMDELVDLAFAD